MGTWRARERKRLKTRITNQRQCRARLHRVWSTTGCPVPSGSPEQVHSSCCGVRFPRASCSYRSLYPPALPTVSATPGAHMPCGNRIRLVLPSKETAGRDGGLGDRGGAGAALAGQGESGSLYRCVTLNSWASLG